MNMTIGTCPGAWGISFADDPHQIPWSQYLDEIVEAGYEWTELGPYGYMPVEVETLKRELSQRHLKLTGGVVMPHLEDAAAWPQIEQQVLQTGESLSNLGAEFLILIDDMYRDQKTGEPTLDPTLDDDAWQCMVDTTHAIACLAKERFELRTTFHPHSETHVEYEYQIDRLLEDTDATLVSLCLDTGHHAYRRGDPIAFIEKHGSRLTYLHLKSVHPAILENIVYQEGKSLAEATMKGVFCEPTDGVIDFAKLRQALVDLNYDGFAIVEQDMYPAPFDKPLPIEKRSRLYYESIGLG